MALPTLRATLCARTCRRPVKLALLASAQGRPLEPHAFQLCTSPIISTPKSFLLKSGLVRHYGKPAAPGRAQTGSDSESDSDSDSEERSTTRRGESDFWRRKIRTVHGILDLNKDGVISFEDYKLLVDRFVDLGHLSPKDTIEFHKFIESMWEEQWGSRDPYNFVTTAQYLEAMHHNLNDKSLKKKVHNFLPYLFKAVDKDKSGEISVEEYKLFFRCLGLSEQDAVVSFNVIDTNMDGRLSFKEFVHQGRDFFLTEDPCRPSKMFWGPLVAN